MSEALIFASTNPQYHDRLFIELQVQYKKIPSSNLGRTYCVQKLFLTFRTIYVHNMLSPVSTKRRASDKDLPVFLSVHQYFRKISEPPLCQYWALTSTISHLQGSVSQMTRHNNDFIRYLKLSHLEIALKRTWHQTWDVRWQQSLETWESLSQHTEN